MKQRRVVCSACRIYDLKDNLIVTLIGARHYDNVMQDQLKLLEGAIPSKSERYDKQGFIDQWGVFMDRYEALEIAEKAKQILTKAPPDNKLFSEDIY